MIVTRLIGGLGNQLFQYAIGRHLALLNGTELRIDASAFESYKLHAYALDHFSISGDPVEADQIAAFDVIGNSRVVRALARGPIPQAKHWRGRTYVREQGMRFDRRILELRGDLYLDGYWQSERYFSDIADTIKDDLQIVEDMDDANLRMAEQIQDSRSVSVHVRLGDFARDPITRKVHGVLGAEYYSAAVRLLAERVPGARFFVFSDEPERALAASGLADPVTTVVDFNPAARNYSDLRLMALCDHHVIANSTFSWWGAWLGEQLGSTITVAPTRWFGAADRDSSDIIPSRWITL